MSIEYWLALIRAPGIGAARFANLLKHFEHPRAVFEADKSEWQAVEKDMLWLDKPQHQLLTLHHSDYPPHAKLSILLVYYLYMEIVHCYVVSK